LIDAVAFALALPLPRGKHAHVRDLVYARNSDDVERGVDNVTGSMFVKLNFEGGLTLKRTYNGRDQVCEQAVIETNGLETPLTNDEYKERIH